MLQTTIVDCAVGSATQVIPVSQTSLPMPKTNRISSLLNNSVQTIKPSLTVKTRMITVRMSSEEYDAICAVGTDLGLRNVSELARTALRALVRTSHHLAEKPAELKLADRIEEHDMLLRSLVQEIRKLKRVAGEHARTETRNKASLAAIMHRNRLR